jgi:CRISPR-associated protein Csc1
MPSESVFGIDIELTLQDSFYYASREAGETFLTRPRVMHTALYYALGLFPSAFRIAEHTPRYLAHREASKFGDSVYLFPAVATTEPSYTTRRFAVKPDEFRQASERGSANFKETGHMKMIDPGITFQTYAVCDDKATRDAVLDDLPAYARVGKKLSLARVTTNSFTAQVQEGEFELAHPIADLDIDDTLYTIEGGLEWERMNPVDLIMGADLVGPHFELDDDNSQAFPSDLRFLDTAEA